jgi:glycine cleavage system aminomethyltransferase T
MSTAPRPTVGGSILAVSSIRYLRSPFFDFYHHSEAHYGVDNERLYPLDLGGDVLAEYQALRSAAMLYDVPERTLEIRGPDAVRLLERVFVRRCANLGIDRAAYALACDAHGGLLMDGVLMRLAEDRFWYVKADGEFLTWLEAHAMGLDVEVFDPQVWVLQVQGPRSIEILRRIADPEIPADWKYFGVASTGIAGQAVVVSRTGWTGEMGFEIYTPIDGPRNAALWERLLECGGAFGLRNAALSSMDIRRIEAGILDYGTDVDRSLNPWQAGLGRFVDMGNPEFIGRTALLACDQAARLCGLRCKGGAPLRGGPVYLDGEMAGYVTASAQSPTLGCGIGYARFSAPAPPPGTALAVDTGAGRCSAEAVTLPFFDPEKRIARGLSPV